MWVGQDGVSFLGKAGWVGWLEVGVVGPDFCRSVDFLFYFFFFFFFCLRPFVTSSPCFLFSSCVYTYLNPPQHQSLSTPTHHQRTNQQRQHVYM